jgi:hypothetical protein
MKKILVLVAALAMVIGLSDLSRSANELNGTYMNQGNKSEYITFSVDGKFFLKQQKKPYDAEQPYVTIEGTYTLNGDTVALKLPDGGEADGKIKGDLFIDNQGKTWLKEGGQQVNPGMKLKKQSNL